MSPFSPITAVVMFGVTWKWLCSLVLTDRIHQWKLTGNIPAGQLSCPVRKVTFFKPPPCSSTLPLPSVPFRSLPLVSRCFSCTSRLFFSLSFSPSLSLSFCASGQIIQMLWRTQTPAPIHFPLPVPPSSFLSLSLSHTHWVSLLCFYTGRVKHNGTFRNLETAAVVSWWEFHWFHPAVVSGRSAGWTGSPSRSSLPPSLLPPLSSSSSSPSSW